MQLVWLRRDLRWMDNPALYHALSNAVTNGEPVTAVYVATPGQWQRHGMAQRQQDVIRRRLEVVKQGLEQLNVPLLYLECDSFTESAERVAELACQLKVTAVHANCEYPLDEQRRDNHFDALLAPESISVYWYHAHCVFPPGRIKNKKGDYFKVFTPFKRAWLAEFAKTSLKLHVPQPAQAMPELPSLPSGWLPGLPAFECGRDRELPVTDEAISERLNAFVEQQAAEYKNSRDFPARQGTSGLSVYLAIGALSVNQCLATLLKNRPVDELNEGEATWLSELIWREFYTHLMAFEPRLSRGEAFVTWTDTIFWPGSKRHLEAWKQGRTGYPIVDAAMRQLNATGWMHNRLRMIVASFLCKDLLINWREGERYFMSQLTDGDYASNNGGWQWCASTGCDGQPWFRIFNPVTQGEKFDPDGAFVRRWLPELKGVPDKYIHRPWCSPAHSQTDYLPPIVDHSHQRALALELYKQAKEIKDD